LRSTIPWEMSSEETPASLIPLEERWVIFALRLPFASAVTDVIVGGFLLLSVTVKSNVAWRIPDIVCLPASAVPWIVPLKTRPCENITNVPLESPVSGTVIEKIPSEFEEHPWGKSEHDV